MGTDPQTFCPHSPPEIQAFPTSACGAQAIWDLPFSRGRKNYADVIHVHERAHAHIHKAKELLHTAPYQNREQEQNNIMPNCKTGMQKKTKVHKNEHTSFIQNLVFPLSEQLLACLARVLVLLDVYLHMTLVKAFLSDWAMEARLHFWRKKPKFTFTLSLRFCPNTKDCCVFCSAFSHFSASEALLESFF